MIIGYGAITHTIQPIASSNSTAAYLSVITRMADGQPGTQCAISWTSGSQTTATYVQIAWQMFPVPVEEVRVFGLLGLRGIPVGTRVRLYGGNVPSPVTGLVETTVRLLPDGTTGVWLVLPEGQGYTYQYYAWRIFNDVSGAATIAASATVYVGEVIARPGAYWPISSFEEKIVDPSLENASYGGPVRRVKRVPYREQQVVILPQQFPAAFSAGPLSLRGLIYQLAAADFFVVIPIEAQPGQSAIDHDAVNETAILAIQKENSGLASNAIQRRWPVRLTFRQIPGG